MLLRMRRFNIFDHIIPFLLFWSKCTNKTKAAMDQVNRIVKFNQQTNGRDKLCRFLQYACKFVGWYTDTRIQQSYLTEQLKQFETSFSSTRKVLRLGKSIDMIQGALKSLDVTDMAVKTCLVAAKLNQACYLLVDHFIWFAKISNAKVDTKYWSHVAARFWLVTLVFNLLRNLYDICNLRIRTKLSSRSGEKQQNTLLYAAFNEDKAVTVDTVKNACDVFLPLSTLGHSQISSGTQGILGMISSLMAMLQTWHADYKIVPA